MKIKGGFILRSIAGSWIVVPIGQRVVEFNGLMTLSDSGAFLWRSLERSAGMEELVASVLGEYDIDEATARLDVQEFVSAVGERGLLE